MKFAHWTREVIDGEECFACRDYEASEIEEWQADENGYPQCMNILDLDANLIAGNFPKEMERAWFAHYVENWCDCSYMSLFRLRKIITAMMKNKEDGLREELKDMDESLGIDVDVLVKDILEDKWPYTE
jgi:hypothetical protein